MRERASRDIIEEGDVAESQLVTRRGPFRALAFRDPVDGFEHMALVFGTATSDDVLVRVHSECLTGDVFGALRCECGDQLDLALDRIVEEGRGVLVYLRGQEVPRAAMAAKWQAMFRQTASAQ